MSSLTVSDIRKAKSEALNSGASPSDILEALVRLERKIELKAAEERSAAWACGRRGDAAQKIPGLTDTLTSLLRRFAACGVVRYGDMEDLHRHKSALCKALKTLAPSVKIATLIGEGYELTGGFDDVYRLLHQGQAPSLRIASFTSKQSMILRLLAQRGSVHVEQTPCLQRHMSNIRAKLKTLGLSKKIDIKTHGGEGLYTLEKGKDVLERLIAGEPLTEAKPKKTKQPEPLRIAA